jgi:YVTN family beta-propeller protein
MEVSGMPSSQPIEAPLFAYVTDAILDAVAVVETAANAVVARVPLGGFPSGIVSSPEDGRVFVTIARRPEDDTGFIAILDPTSHTVVARIPVAEIGPHSIVITPDGRRAYAPGDDKVFVVDTAAKTVIATVPVGSLAFGSGIAISPDGKHVYVASGSHTVSVLATHSNAVIATIQTPANLGAVMRITVAPDGKRAYVTSSIPTLGVLDTATNTISATIVVGNTQLEGVAFSPDGKHAYIAGTDEDLNSLFDSVGKMVVIDTATNTVEHAVPIPHTRLWEVAVSPDGKHAYFVGDEQVVRSSQPGNFLGRLESFDTAANTSTQVNVGIDLRDITLTLARR